MQVNLRKVLAWAVALVMLCTLLPLSAVVSAANVDVLTNGNFETGNGNGWKLESGTSVTPAAPVAPAVAPSYQTASANDFEEITDDEDLPF